jgi:hypothetical protein
VSQTASHVLDYSLRALKLLSSTACSRDGVSFGGKLLRRKCADALRFAVLAYQNTPTVLAVPVDTTQASFVGAF